MGNIWKIYGNIMEIQPSLFAKTEVVCSKKMIIVIAIIITETLL